MINESGSVADECKDDSRYAALSGASLVSKRTPAMLTNVQDSNFGYKSSDWDKVKQLYGKNAIVGRSGNGEASILTEGQKNLGINNFKPMYRDASDGGIIDLSNKARLKGTLTGAGVGLLVLFRTNRHIWHNIAIIFCVYIAGVLFGRLAGFFF